MIVYRKGNAVEALKNGDIDVLVHGVNCQGKMNSGIAKEIREAFPQVFEEYSKEIKFHRCFKDNEGHIDTKALLGHTQTVRLDNGFKFVVNAFTQDLYGYEKGTKYCSYDAIDDAMKEIAEKCQGAVKIGMPKIGSKRGGGNWTIIEAIINSHFPSMEVYVYEL
jgi:O-acetyl-ADP-ribose deacetylase (regulator of RNase III)